MTLINLLCVHRNIVLLKTGEGRTITGKPYKTKYFRLNLSIKYAYTTQHNCKIVLKGGLRELERELDRKLDKQLERKFERELEKEFEKELRREPGGELKQSLKQISKLS